MEILPVKTRVLNPPQDDLLAALREAKLALKNGDVLLVSSKVMAIDEGRCVPIAGADKQELTIKEAERYLSVPYRQSPLTIKHHTFLGSAGIDESNGAGYYILLPTDPFASARKLHQTFLEQFSLSELGVIVTDSCSKPLRYGSNGVALGWWGIEPVDRHVGKSDLFGREIQHSRSNLVDALAAAATLVMGEVAECQPAAIIRGLTNLVFTTEDTRHKLFASPEYDHFRELYKGFSD